MIDDSRSNPSSRPRPVGLSASTSDGLDPSRLPDAAVRGRGWPVPPLGNTVGSVRQHAVWPNPGNFKPDTLGEGMADRIGAARHLSANAGPALGLALARGELGIAGWGAASATLAPKVVAAASFRQVAAIDPTMSRELPRPIGGLIQTTDTP